MIRAPDRDRLTEFLHLAADAAGSLSDYHASRGVHGAMSRAWLSGAAPAGATDMWPYLSPEQTGRLQSPVDERSDLYGLGVVLYEELTGQLPFTAADPLEWTHRHLAVAPLRPREVDPAVPEAVEMIIMRLLEKDPEDRYLTAAGLRHDLERCLEEWEEGRAITPFALGTRDRADRVTIPEKLYGRERERRVLLDAVAAVSLQTGPRVVLVSGTAGVGKSTLVRELEAPVAAAGGYLVGGKFEDAPRGVLYGPIASGFSDLMTLILAGGDASVAAWRTRLLSAVGDTGQVLGEALPELELVLGPAPPVESVPATEAHYRFAGAFRGFVGVFATAEHPLVLVLDDVQWADAASLQLIGDLVTDRSLRSLLVVLTYRDDAPARAAFTRLLDELHGAGTAVETLALAPLEPEPFAQLLSDTLGMTDVECEPLVTALYTKSAGNPLFFTQLLVDLHRVGLLRFDRDALRWSWDQTAIERFTLGGSVVDLLTHRLAECPPEMRRTLSLAACLGGSFDADLLAAADAREPGETAALIDGAVSAGLLTRLSGGYRFTHDRVREVAYAAIPPERRPPTHLRMGQALLATGADVAEAVAQLDRGRSAIERPLERRELARLNLLAADRARRTAAFDALSEYCDAGLDVLGPEGWESDRDLVYALTFQRAEAELFAGHHEEAERLLASVVAFAGSRLERARCARLWIDVKVACGALVEGLAFPLEVMREFGLEVDLKPTNLEQIELALQARLGATTDEVLRELPRGQDAEMDALFDLLARTAPQSAIFDRAVFRLLVCVAIDLTLDHGVYAASVWSLAAYGFIRAGIGDYLGGDRYARLALRLADEHGFRAHRAGVCTLLAVSLWTREVHSAIDMAREGIRTGIRNGEIHNAALGCVLLCLDRLIAGAPLAEIEGEAEDGVEVARRVEFAGEAANLVLIRQLVRALRGHTDALAALTDQEFDERALAECLERNAAVGLNWWFHVYVLQLQVLAGEFSAALRTRDQLEPDLPFIQGFPLLIDAEFFAALAVAGCDPDGRAGRLELLSGAARRFAEWAEACPENFDARAAIVAGELARVEGRDGEALEQFALAHARAQRSGFVHLEALAHESAARLCRELGRHRQADRHAHDAIVCFREWGATAKAAQLEQTLATRGHGHGDAQVDALAVARAAQAISSEVEHSRVLARLLETAVMQAGARGGQLLLCRDGETVVAARAEDADGAPTVTLYEPPLPLSGKLVPASVVHYVTRTQTPLILGDAQQRSPFAADPYIRQRHIRSLLCVPLIAQRELHGLLCVENELIPEVFTKPKLAALEVIASQAVISFENALARERLRAVADEQSMLHRLAELVARGADPQLVFDTACAETATLFDVPMVNLFRVTGDRTCVVVAAWGASERHLSPGTELAVGLDTVTGRVLRTGAPARVDSYEDIKGDIGVRARELGVRSAVGAPVVLDNKIWGVLQVGTATPTPLPPGTEEKLTRLTDLIATAISNAAARSELIASRARVIAAGDDERRRIERNLHDGAQQQLIILGLQLQALESLIPTEAADAQVALQQLRQQNDAVLEQIQQISRGLHPSALTHRGLAPALRALARASPIPVDLTVECDERLPESVEICVYYVISECLTNAAKHSSAEHVSVAVRLDGGVLHVRIDDDGRGGAGVHAGSGLIGLIDRVEAIGGRFELTSPLGGGTHVRIELVSAPGGVVLPADP